MAEKVTRSLCGFCHTNCGLRVHIQNDKITRIEGDPEHPVNRGYLCPKAQALKPMLTSEERLKFPLMKTKSGLSRVSWNEALDYAAERLTRIKHQFGPESVFLCTGAPMTYGARDGFRQFMGAYGSPNLTGSSNLCFVPRRIAFSAAFGGRPEPDFDNSRLIIFWGSNPLNSTRFTNFAAFNGFNRIIPRAKERGAKIIVIDPVRAEIVSQADEWVRPNIGTDTALSLAMVNTIINEGIYDEAFIGQWLIQFDEIKKHVVPFTPEWAEKITSVPADRIKELARLYATTEGAVIVDGNGIDMHTNGVDMARSICLLIAVTGNIDKPGGNVFLPWVPQTLLPTIKPGKKHMSHDQFPLFPHVPFPFIKESILSGKQGSPRGMIAHHSNPVLIQANQKRTIQALKKLDFTMVLDIFPTCTTEIADLVLPAAADLEAVDYRCYSSTEGGFVALREKVAEPLCEARSVFDIEYDLSMRMGLEESYPFRNPEEWINFVLKPAEITLDKLRSDHIVYGTTSMAYQKYKKRGFNTPSGKVECYSEKFRNANRGSLPAFEHPKESQATHGDLMQKYRLSATTRRPAEYVHTKLVNLSTGGRNYPVPLVRMNEADAKPRAIEQGDLVEVESARGRIQLKAQVTPDVSPGLVSIDFGWGNPTDNKASMNLLTSDEVWDPVSGAYPTRLLRCDIKKLVR